MPILVAIAWAMICVAFSAAAAEACSCATVSTACGALSSTPVVFAGRVTKDTGEGNGEDIGRMIVEEVLHGLPDDVGEVDVDTMARTSCYMRLQEGSRVVIFGSRDSQNPKLIRYHACSFSFRVAGNEALLDALRAAEAKAPSRLVGSVVKRVDRFGSGSRAGAGLTVIAVKNGERLKTSTTGDGEFEFRVIDPGAWSLTVEGAGILHDLERESPKEPTAVPANGCGFRRLSIVSDGHISGRVADGQGRPVAGVPVQAFGFDGRWKEFEPSSFSEARTDEDGRYDIKGLPAQEYIVGINGDKYKDAAAYPPAFYGSARRDEARPVTLKEAERRSGVDITVEPAREKATVIVELRNEDGSLVTVGSTPVVLRVEDTENIQRGFAIFERAEPDGRFEVSVWNGEVYQFVASRHKVDMVEQSGGVLRGGVTSWEGRTGPVRVTTSGIVVQVTLLSKPPAK